ncbi:hypothetical protein AAA136_01090 [Phocaeicola vulgatus]
MSDLLTGGIGGEGGMLPFPYVLPLCGLAGASRGMAVDSSNRP